ncbi:MAG: sigma-54-dependent Fis family transcriptional regulator [Deltaproteobacteria bacterium]|nr:sigma-54-dependent Fis family transcriptional regulator [Deltaproteobacteria bacterium]
MLLVDDEPGLGKVLGALLRQEGIGSLYASSGEEALGLLASRPVDVVVSDLRMPGMDGMQLFARVQARWPEVPVVFLTAHGTVALAVEAMRAGAADFLLKPVDRQELLFTVRKALARAAREPAPSAAPEGFVGDSGAMREVYALLDRAARGHATVLLRGESGTGKEVAARALHARSPRRDGPFVAIHCAALPDALLESELFGYEKGAFTGAVQRKPGRLELAQGGTVFLDEVGEVTPAVQAKLLRVLQERQFERLGGTATLRADVRFVAATHRDLEAMIAQGTFREDLFYRLSVVPLWLPPLRARPEDIAPLARSFCARFGRDNGRPEVTLADSAIARLQAEPWPGNVRQLQNFIERLVVLALGARLTAEDVDRELSRRPSLAPGVGVGAGAAQPVGTLDHTRREAEREALAQALQRAGGNRTLAARLLGVSRRTLYNKLEEHGLG